MKIAVAYASKRALLLTMGGQAAGNSAGTILETLITTKDTKY
jgi:hypothetical protein